MKYDHLFLYSFLITALVISSSASAFAQGPKKSEITLSGLVVEGDSSFGVIGAYVMIPKAGIGTVTNDFGFFKLSVKPGDSVLISYVSYDKVYYQIPEDADSSYSIMVNMTPSNTVLANTVVYPFPTKALFKQAFLELDLDDQRIKNMERQLNHQAMRRMAAMLDADGASNHRQYMSQYIERETNQYFAPSFSILNPFAWANFIKSIKRGDLKSEEP